MKAKVALDSIQTRIRLLFKDMSLFDQRRKQGFLCINNIFIYTAIFLLSYNSIRK
jgi:hypothetical protein